MKSPKVFVRPLDAVMQFKCVGRSCDDLGGHGGWLRQRPLGAVSLMKVDVQGFEPQVTWQLG